jgi:hypothetical protein
MGHELRGKALAAYGLAKARGGCQVVFSLVELDSAFRDNEILLADGVGGQPRFDYQGPVRLVVPHEGPGARSIRMLNELEAVHLRKWPR